MDFFNKYWGVIVAIGGVIIGVAGWLFNQGIEYNSLEGKTFDSPEQKVEVVKYVKDAPTPKDMWQKHLRDSLDSVNRVNSRKIRDSLMVLEYEARKKTDSINILNADQLFQIKEELKKLIES
tara:strand:+ start:624 stop:989 length:366 start_codon:yes stop_codon:yes gene_type:complete